MKQTIGFHQFLQAFRDHNREDQFSYEGFRVFFDYVEEYCPDFNLDVIAICRDYAEDTIEDIASKYSIDIADLDEDDAADEVKYYLQYYGAGYVGETAIGLVYALF